MAVYTKLRDSKTGMTKTPSEGAFDCLRLLAAGAVLYSHCYPLRGRDADEPLTVLSGHLTIGTVAVYVFFAISGYLVTQSWLRDPSVRRFMMRRALRIFPALIFVIAGSFAVLGPLATDLPISDYFSRRTAWSYLAKILIYPTQYGLPGVFDDNPMASVVNGSLWTLRLEFGLYIIVVAFGICGGFRFRHGGIALAAMCCSGYAALPFAARFTNIAASSQVADFFANAAPFFIGMALAQNGVDSHRARILFLATLVATILLIPTPHFYALLLLSLPCVVIWLAHQLQCHLGSFGDYSYGIYLWAFPVTQMFVHFQPGLTLMELLLLAGAVTLLLAVFSWHAIEKQALHFKPRRTAM